MVYGGVSSLGFRVYGLRSWVRVSSLGFTFSVYDLGFRI